MELLLQDQQPEAEAPALKDRVRHALILGHFRACSKPSDGRTHVFSLPSGTSAFMQTLKDFFARPAGHGSRVPAALEDGMEGGPECCDKPVFFTVTKARPSANSLLYVRPGAGQSLHSGHVAIALHPGVPEGSAFRVILPTVMTTAWPCWAPVGQPVRS